MKPAAMTDLDIFINSPEDATPEELVAYLDQACGDDQALRHRVEELFAPHGRSEHFMEHTTFPRAEADLIDTESAGSVIGNYKLLQKIGEGGFGVVYMADQLAPVKRRVALKIIKLGMDTKQVVARFEVERQALALMEHPNIASVFDAGATELGRPYFVMELVRGVPITKFCEEQKLDTAARLSLFMDVCSAIQHAHQKGIIHRDLKPNNVIVTLHDDKAVPKVIDFGVAKAIHQDLTDKTLFTQFEQFIGTPAYMSPEQAQMSGLDIDTRADIYALGVLLYELLTGTTPFEARALASAGQDEMRRVICEEEPPRPSTRLTEVQKRTLTYSETKCPGSNIDRDLDWIVMKALEKDRTRRYDNATGLAADIGRHLAHQPVEAGPPGFSYRFGKIVRRHQAAVITSATMIVLLLGSAVVSTSLWLRAEEDKKDAVAARNSASENERLAKEKKETARIHAYASDMNLVQTALRRNNLGRAQDLLNRHRPADGGKGLRGWEWRYLWQQCQSDEIETLFTSKKSIDEIAFSAKGKWIATADYRDYLGGGFIRVWDVRKRKMHRIFPKNGPGVLAFSPNDKLLAFADKDDEGTNLVRLWNFENEEIIRNLSLDSKCWNLVFSKDGKSLVTSDDKKVTRWNLADESASPSRYRIFPLQNERKLDNWQGNRLAVANNLSKAYVGYMDGRQILEVDLDSGKVEPWPEEVCEKKLMSIALSPDETRLVTGSGMGESTIKVWDTTTKSVIGTLEGHRSWVSALVFSENGKRLISASADQTICLWDLEKMDLIRVFRGHLREIWDLAMDANDNLVSCSKDGTVKHWDVREHHGQPELLKVQTRISDTHSNGAWGDLHWTFAPDSKSIFSLDGKGQQVCRWSGPKFEKKDVILSDVQLSRGVAISKYDELIAMNSENGVITVWDLRESQLASKLAIPVTDPESDMIPIRFTGEDSLWVLVEEHDELQEWNHRTAVMIRKVSVPQLSEFPKIFENNIGWHRRALSERSYLGMTGGGKGILVDLESGKRQDFDRISANTFGCAISPDGDWLAVCHEPGKLDLSDARTGVSKVSLGGVLTSFKSVGFSPDMTRVVASSEEEEAVKLWEMSKFQELVTLPGEGSNFSGAAFSPDGNMLGTINDQGVIHIWLAPSWDEIEEAEAQE